MKLIKNPNSWSCLLCSAAMVLGIDLDEAIRKVGHDGSEIVDATCPSPANRRGFHIQEIIDLACSMGCAITEIHAIPTRVVSFNLEGDHLDSPASLVREKLFNIFPEDKARQRFSDYLAVCPGILAGQTEKFGHAVAWNQEKIYDPKGKIYGLDELDFDIYCLYIFNKMEL